MKTLFCEHAGRKIENAEVFRAILYTDETCKTIYTITEAIDIDIAVEAIMEDLRETEKTNNPQIAIKCGAGELTYDTGCLSVGEVAWCLIDHTKEDCPCKENALLNRFDMYHL